MLELYNTYIERFLNKNKNWGVEHSFHFAHYAVC